MASSFDPEKCQGTTLKKKQCKLKPLAGSKYCWQHQNQDNFEPPPAIVAPPERFGKVPGALINKISKYLNEEDQKQMSQVGREFNRAVEHNIKRRLSYCIKNHTYSDIIYVDNSALLKNKTASLLVLNKAKEIIFSDGFNSDISILSQLSNLQRLTFGFKFNKPIDDLAELSNLTYLKFGIKFDQSLEPLRNLINLEHLEFENEITDTLKQWRKHMLFFTGRGGGFNQSLEPLAGLTNLRFLKLGDNYNQPIDDLENLTNLEHLEFGHNFNQPIGALAHLTNITYLKFDYSFNRSVDSLASLTNLTHLEFGDTFRQDITPITTLTNLEYLNLGLRQRPINGLLGLSKLKFIRFSSSYNDMFYFFRQAIPGIEIVYF